MPAPPERADEAGDLGEQLQATPWSRWRGMRMGRAPGAVTRRSERIVLIALPGAVLIAGVVQTLLDPSYWSDWLLMFALAASVSLVALWPVRRRRRGR